MATGALAGYRGEILTSSSAGGTLAAIAEIRNWEAETTMAEIDATTHDSSGHKEVIAGTDSWTATADGLFVTSGATHKAAFDKLVAKTLFDVALYPTGSSSDGYYSGTGYFTNWRLGSPNDDALALNLSIVGTGVLARSSSTST